MKVDKETFGYLLACAEAAGQVALRRRAAVIAEAIILVKPDNAAANRVAALSLLQAGETQRSKEIVKDNVLSKDPGDSWAKTILALALEIEGDKAGRDSLAAEIVAAGDHAGAVAVAEEIRGR